MDVFKISVPNGIEVGTFDNTNSRCSVMFGRRCVSLWKRKYFVWDPKEDTTRNQWFSCIYNTVPEQFNPNIGVCAAHFTEDCFLILRVPYNAVYTKTFSIKWGNFNIARTVWRFWLTACNVFLFKEFATDYSNASFEPCRVVLVICRFSDHKCRHDNVYAPRCNATRKKTV